MPGFAQPNLPQITRFLAGLVTNRNPIDTPFSIVGLNIVQHHDALNDGLNMELSAYNTLVRRPGFSPLPFWFPSGISLTPRDFFSYTKLNGEIHLFYDFAGSLYVDHDLFVTSDTPSTNIWSLVSIGNFIYAANGHQAIRINSPFLNITHPMGLKPPSAPPTLAINTASKSLYLSDFVPTNDVIAGTLQITDTTQNRTLTITISTGNVHFNVTLLGLPISTQSNYTQVDAATVTGTAPNTTSTDVITQTTGMTGTATGTGISNGVLNYYPDQGMSMLDFDVAFAGNITLPLLVSLINNVQNLSITEGGFTTASLVPLKVFVSGTVIPGMVASVEYPDTPAVAMELTGNGA